MKVRIEYRIIQDTRGAFLKELNRMANDGWSPVGNMTIIPVEYSKDQYSILMTKNFHDTSWALV